MTTPLRVIPEYYTDKDFEEYKALPPSYYDIVCEDCELYKQAVSEAVRKAKEQFIDKHLHKNVLYSKTWK